MECQNCKTQKLITRVRAKFGDNLPTEVASVLHDACLCCSHNCRNCRISVRPESHLPPQKDEPASKKPRTSSVYDRKRLLERRILSLSQLKDSATPSAAPFVPERTRHGAQLSVDEEMDAFMERDRTAPVVPPTVVSTDPVAVAAAKRELAHLIVKHCARCDQSQDDNPSHRGITFVSKDADTGSDDPNSQLEDWLLAQKETDAEVIYRSGCTRLPADIEDALRRQIADFASLSAVDKLLVVVLLTLRPGVNRYYTLTDFAKLRWLHDDPDLANLLENGISKQAAHVRYRNIVHRLPQLASIAHGQIGKGKGGGDNRHNRPDLEEDQTDFLSDLFAAPDGKAHEAVHEPSDAPSRRTARAADPEGDSDDDSPPRISFAPNHSTAVRSAADSVDPDPDND